MGDYTLTGDGRNGTLTLKGAFGIDYAELLKKALLEALEKYSEVSLDLSAIEGVDVSTLQLLCSAEKSFAGAGKELKLSGEPSQEFNDVVSRAGFANILFKSGKK